MTEYRTSDTDELAPYPGMKAEDLRDFEDYCYQVERGFITSFRAFMVCCSVAALLALLIALTN